MTQDLQNFLPVAFFHGSSAPFPVGFELKGRGVDYEAAWSGTDFYAILESCRPAGFTAHRDAVFMVGSPDDIDLAGGATDWILQMVPAGTVSRHDINWSSEISCLISNGHDNDSPEIKNAARSYWSGVPHSNESVWEYLATMAHVSRCEPYETFELNETEQPKAAPRPCA